MQWPFCNTPFTPEAAFNYNGTVLLLALNCTSRAVAWNCAVESLFARLALVTESNYSVRVNSSCCVAIVLAVYVCCMLYLSLHHKEIILFSFCRWKWICGWHTTFQSNPLYTRGPSDRQATVKDVGIIHYRDRTLWEYWSGSLREYKTLYDVSSLLFSWFRFFDTAWGNVN